MFYHRRHHPVAGAMVAGAVAGAVIAGSHHHHHHCYPVATAVVAVHHPVAAVVHHTTHATTRIKRLRGVGSKYSVFTKYLDNANKFRHNNRAMDDLSPFERLPCELVCMIIDYTPEAFFQLGKTSKILRSHAYTYALEPAKISLVKQITFEFADGNIVLVMRKHTTGLFLLRLKLRSPNPGDDDFYRGMRSGNTICRLPFDLILRDNFFQLLTECMGSKIDTVRIYQWSNQEATILKLLDEIKFETLKIARKKFSNEHFDFIVNICEVQSIEELFLYCNQNDCANPVNTLMKLSWLVKTIVIEQGTNIDVLTQQYFFGLTNADWAPIILDMFSGKMDKLSMATAHPFGFLSATSADILRARLPCMGKKVWFAAGELNDETNDIIENDYVIRGPTANRRGSWLTVKHLSRQDETIEEFIL